jgi:PIN domain nuclease of toxin-antitoxin system
VRLLLDTHIWIWSLLAPDRLSAEVHAALTEQDHELWLSAISVWEALVLIRKGRLRVTSANGQAWVTEALNRSPVREAALSFEIARISEQLPFDHQDPADRLIAATAYALDATLITADARLRDCPDIKVMANL